MIARHLDVGSIRAFVNIAELGSFTRAAHAAKMSQSAVSLKLKRLEEQLGCRLVVRTPRHVCLSAKGEAFLEHARNILEANDRAFDVFIEPRQRLTIGISDHVAGPELATLIARMNAQNSKLLIEIRIGSSGDLLKSFDRRELDATIVRLDAGRTDGQLLAEEQFGWYAAVGWKHREDEPLPIATLAEPCGVRIMAGQLLDEAHIPWTEIFVGGGVTAVSAAVAAGVGVAALARRMLPIGAVDVGPRLQLPALPKLPIILHSRPTNDMATEALATLSSSFRSAV